MSQCQFCNAEIETIKVRNTGRNVDVEKAYVRVVMDSGVIVRGRPVHEATCPGAWRRVGGS